MITRELGSTGCQVPIIAQGTTGTGPLQSACPDKDSRRISVLQKGIELGLNWLDTAELYGGGHSELLVGEAIKGRRSEVFVSSKFNPANSDSAALRKALEGSLKRLKTDYIDLYQIHWPSIAVAAEETLGVLGDFVREGKVRYIGVCNVTIDELKHIHATCPAMASVQMELSPVERSAEQDVLKFCMDNQITLIGYSALSFCNWFRERFIDRVQPIMSAYEITFHQLIVEWLTKKPNVTLALKAASEANLLANAAVSLQLSEEHQRQLDEIFSVPVSYIEPGLIDVSGINGDYYRSRAAAIENQQDIIPAPSELAQRVERYGIDKPVWLALTGNPEKPYRLIREQTFFWAWVLAYGCNKPIPAYVL